MPVPTSGSTAGAAAAAAGVGDGVGDTAPRPAARANACTSASSWVSARCAYRRVERSSLWPDRSAPHPSAPRSGRTRRRTRAADRAACTRYRTPSPPCSTRRAGNSTGPARRRCDCGTPATSGTAAACRAPDKMRRRARRRVGVPDRVLILGRGHAEQLLHDYARHFKAHRPHQGRQQLAPHDGPTVMPLPASQVKR